MADYYYLFSSMSGQSGKPAITHQVRATLVPAVPAGAPAWALAVTGVSA
jgi:hypothetical protein